MVIEDIEETFEDIFIIIQETLNNSGQCQLTLIKGLKEFTHVIK